MKEREEEIRLLRKTKQDLQFRVQVRSAALNRPRSCADDVVRWRRRGCSERRMH